MAREGRRKCGEHCNPIVRLGMRDFRLEHHCECESCHNGYICPMCRKYNKHFLCSTLFCDCTHGRTRKIDKKSDSESVHTVSGGLPTLGKGHK